DQGRGVGREARGLGQLDHHQGEVRAHGRQPHQGLRREGRHHQGRGGAVRPAPQRGCREALQGARREGGRREERRHQGSGGLQGFLSKGATMNKDTAKGDWKQLSGAIKHSWGKLTDDDLLRAKGDGEYLVGKLQEYYGLSRTRPGKACATSAISCAAANAAAASAAAVTTTNP